MTSQQPRTLQTFFRSGPMPCPYLHGRVERNLFTLLAGQPDADLHDRLTEAGFRRSHKIVYKPACPDCAACTPVRVPVTRFRPGKSLRRIRNANVDLTARIIPLDPQPEHFALFQHYQRSRHGDSDMAAMGFADYQAMIEDTVGQTRLVEFRTPEGILVAACLADFMKNGISAVYSYFDPTRPKRGLGSFMVAWLIDHGAANGLSYVYLGYWIEDSEKMSYKKRFRPLEALGPHGWKEI